MIQTTHDQKASEIVLSENDTSVELYYAEDYDLKKNQKKLRYCKILVPMACICFCLLFFIAVAEAIFIVVEMNDDPWVPESDNDVLKTTEFQMKLVSFKNAETREEGMEKWMRYFAKKSKYFSFDSSVTVKSKTRKQYYLDSKGEKKCGPDYEIRVEEYVGGDINGTSTIDIKDNSQKESTARNMPFWPSSKYINNSKQKCERDEHECSHKYSRETRLYMDEWKEWSTCRDLVEMFPWAYKDLTAKQLDYKVKPGDMKYWFIQEYEGYLDDDTRFKAAFTMKYHSLDEAMNDHAAENATKGEWSIRLYSLDGGLSSEYNKDVYDDVTKAWKSLINHYGNDDC